MKSSFKLLFLCTLSYATFPAWADTVQPYTAQEIQPYRAKEIEPYHATEIQSYTAKEIQQAPRASRGLNQAGSSQKPQVTQSGHETIQVMPPAQTAHVFTPEERRKMSENDDRAGRTAKSMSKTKRGSRRGEKANGNANYCAPNCGYDYGTGQSAPTLYNPNYNYSP